MKERLEPRERLAVGEDDLGDVAATGRPEAVEERVPDFRVVLDQLVDDLVARDRRGAVTRERS